MLAFFSFFIVFSVEKGKRRVDCEKHRRMKSVLVIRLKPAISSDLSALCLLDSEGRSERGKDVLVPRAGLEPARPFGQRIFLPL